VPTLDDFFRDQPLSRQLFEAVKRLMDESGPAEMAR
jgi:hypothetical protein